MVFRRCSLRGKDFGGHSVAAAIDQPADRLGRPRPSKDRGLEALLSRAIREADVDSPIYLFFLTMAICNTVVVNAKPHEDLMDPDGDMIDAHSEETDNGERLTISPLSVKFLEEVEEEVQSVPNLDTPRESIELIKSVDKRQSQSSTETITPLHSYYDSESPDELALVEAAREYGVRLLRRRFDEIVVHLRASGQTMKYKLLHTLPFDSDRKRMSVVVQECSGKKRVLLLTKGADATVLPILSNEYATSLKGEEEVFKAQEHLSDYAREGLRTLCLGIKHWKDEDYQSWRALHEEAELDPHHRENLLRDSTLKAEQDVDLLGVTAIEDRLQEGVPECIHLLREAGICVWVLTGDKVETAVNIAFSSRLFSSAMDLLNIGANGVRSVSDLLDEHLIRVGRAGEITEEAAFGLVLNASCLDYCLDPHNEERFVRLLKRFVSTQWEFLGMWVMVNSFQLSQCPVLPRNPDPESVSGETGEDSSQWEGARHRGWCKRCIHDPVFRRGCWSVGSGGHASGDGERFCDGSIPFPRKPPADPWTLVLPAVGTDNPLLLLQERVPSLLYGCLEQDASADILLDVPQFYDQGRLGKKYRWYSFWLNMLDAIWQSAVVYWICHFTYINTDCDMWTFGVVLCAQLLLVNTFHLALLLQYWVCFRPGAVLDFLDYADHRNSFQTWPMFLSMFLSVVSFFVCALFYNGFVTANWTWTNVKDTPVSIAQLAMIDPIFWLVGSRCCRSKQFTIEKANSSRCCCFRLCCV
ncbi:IC domain protein, HAD ATPase, P-type family [Ancylostoma duodenale]|uniref:IC domain protein, HAD ATPase, P-type family n=1 Tax=Ancylostoma duodenale TaxID=51022 RepID=A0A0C2DEG2_9BILA|nr:IC domain protein, HAD ATPase, P-type family [Ancylostoma duodenale]